MGQRVFGIALGYEDPIDHDALRHDPALGVVLGRLEARRPGCAPLAGKSTLNRLEHAPQGAHRYRRIGHDAGAIERLFVDLFLDAHAQAPEQLILDLDATDDPLHGRQEGRFFHGYYDCHCYLPLYIFCADHLLAAKLRRSNIDASAGAVEEVEHIVARTRSSIFGASQASCRPTPMPATGGSTSPTARRGLSRKRCAGRTGGGSSTSSPTSRRRRGAASVHRRSRRWRWRR